MSGERSREAKLETKENETMKRENKTTDYIVAIVSENNGAKRERRVETLAEAVKIAKAVRQASDAFNRKPVISVRDDLYGTIACF